MTTSIPSKRRTTGSTFQRILVIWTAAALVIWGLLFLIAQRILLPQIGYYLTLFALVGVPLWLRRERIAAVLSHWQLPRFARFLVLGYAMVLLEEIFAAIFNHLLEPPFRPELLLIRVGQFWAFNVLAFTGLIWGWFFLQTRIGYSRREQFFLIGLWGVYAEHTYLALAGNVLAFFLVAPLNIFAYGIILSPAMLSQADSTTRRFPRIVRYGLAFILPFFASIPTIIVLMVLRTQHPGWFPPCKFIAC